MCFKGDKLGSIQLPGYDAEYKDYKDFNGKQVPRTIREYIEPGTELEATITELHGTSRSPGIHVRRHAAASHTT